MGGDYVKNHKALELECEWYPGST